MNSQSQYIRELGQEEIKSNKFKCKSKATDELDSQKVIHDNNKPRKSLLWQWFGYQWQLPYDFVNLSVKFLQNFSSVRQAIHFCIKFHSVFHPISRILKVGLAKPFFQTTSQCLNITWNTLSWVWYWYFWWDDIGWNLCFVLDIITSIVSNQVRCALLSPLTIGYTPEQHRFISALKSSDNKTSEYLL